jgi:hydroxymethylbilane synthase
MEGAGVGNPTPKRPRALRLGTRGSPLALAQARSVAEALGDAEIVPIRTSGDERGPRDPGPGDGPAPGGEGEPPGAGTPEDKGRFVREIEAALLRSEIDLAVHSAKDLPAELPAGLVIAGVPARADPADAFVGGASSLEELPEGAAVGTSSLRRRAQLLARRPDLRIVGLRGNVDTRLRRLAERELDGIVLAAAGLHRLGRAGEISFTIPADRMTPAAGQGALAVEARRDDPAQGAAAALSDPAALAELGAERATVAELGATCETPIGVGARLEGEELSIEAFVGLPDGSEWLRDGLRGGAGDPAALGRELAARLRSAGAGELLERAALEAVR